MQDHVSVYPFPNIHNAYIQCLHSCRKLASKPSTIRPPKEGEDDPHSSLKDLRVPVCDFGRHPWLHYALTASAATATLMRKFTQDTDKESLCKLRRFLTKARASSALSVCRSAAASRASLLPKYPPLAATSPNTAASNTY